LVRVLLRNGVSFGEFSDLAKWVYVDVAARELGIPGRKQTNSRISILTGLSRKEVLRVKRLERPVDEETISRYNRAARVVGGWVRDPSFQDADGQPRPLPIEGENSFTSLVQRYSGDVPIRAILDELRRVGTVKEEPDGRMRLVARAYIPQGDETLKLGVLGTDVADLIETINHNLTDDGRMPRFQRKVSYDNIPREALDAFRKLSGQEAQTLLERLDGWLAAYDRDTNPQARGTGRTRVGIGIYYFEEDLHDETQQNPRQDGQEI